MSLISSLIDGGGIIKKEQKNVSNSASRRVSSTVPRRMKFLCDERMKEKEKFIILVYILAQDGKIVGDDDDDVDGE